MEWDHFRQHRAFLFHFTRTENLPFLRAHRAMHSVAHLVGLATEFENGQVENPFEFLHQPRQFEMPLRLGPGDHNKVTVNDQKPICDGQIGDRFEPGWNRSRYTALLNQYVFFYAGRDQVPGGRAAGSFVRKYHAFARLRIPVDSVEVANPAINWLLSRFNTGGGQARGKVLRGPSLFIPFAQFPDHVQQIAEVVFGESVALPDDTEVRMPGAGNWEIL
jgi:hypothetical protein